MNAGAYGGELGEWIQKVWALDREFRPVVLPRDELEMSYRHSLFMEQPFLITDCEFSLKTGDTEDAKMQLKEYNRRRREKQPLEYPSAGSTFRRPPGYFAGALIEEAGLKGYQIGGAQVSEKHAGFIINTGNASAKDIIALISYVRETVIRQSGVMLQSEVRIVGEEI